MTTPVLGSFPWGDVGVAFGAGLVATAAWTGVVLAWRWSRLRRRLNPFAGTYDIYPKLGEKAEGIAEVEVSANLLRVAFREQRIAGFVEGSILMNGRFLRTGHGAYTHRFKGGALGWGSWDVELHDDAPKTILVTTRYPDPDRPVEVVRGYEWRLRGP